MSFKEKSILGSLIITTGLFGYYFIVAFKVFMAGTSGAIEDLPLILIAVVIAVVVVEIAYHALISVISRPESEDERDRLIDAKATRIAYFVLVAGCLFAIGHTTLSVYVDDAVASNPLSTANLVLLAFILAEVVGFAAQLWFYRRGF